MVEGNASCTLKDGAPAAVRGIYRDNGILPGLSLPMAAFDAIFVADSEVLSWVADSGRSRADAAAVLVEAFAGPIALAVDNARLFGALTQFVRVGIDQREGELPAPFAERGGDRTLRIGARGEALLLPRGGFVRGHGGRDGAGEDGHRGGRDGGCAAEEGHLRRWRHVGGQPSDRPART